MTLPPCPWCGEEPNDEPIEFFEGVAKIYCASCELPLLIQEVIEYVVTKDVQ